MQADETMTKQESEEMIKQLEKVFDIVRLLDEETLYGMEAVVLSQRAARYASAILFGEGMKFVRTVFH